MTYEFYKILHLVGVMGLFLSLGGALAMQGNANPPTRKLIAIFHGIGLLLIFVAGFGLIAKLKTGFPVWVIIKMVLWLIAGAMIAFGKRRIFSPAVMWILAIVIGLTAAWLGVKKPFHTPPGTAAVSAIEVSAEPR